MGQWTLHTVSQAEISPQVQGKYIAETYPFSGTVPAQIQREEIAETYPLTRPKIGAGHEGERQQG